MPTKSKQGCRGARLSHLMDAEAWLSAHKAVELGFADDLLFTAKGRSRSRAGRLCVLAASGDKPAAEQAAPYEKTEQKQPAEPLYQRLNL